MGGVHQGVCQALPLQEMLSPLLEAQPPRPPGFSRPSRHASKEKDTPDRKRPGQQTVDNGIGREGRNGRPHSRRQGHAGGLGKPFQFGIGGRTFFRYSPGRGWSRRPSRREHSDRLFPSLPDGPPSSPISSPVPPLETFSHLSQQETGKRITTFELSNFDTKYEEQALIPKPKSFSPAGRFYAPDPGARKESAPGLFVS